MHHLGTGSIFFVQPLWFSFMPNIHFNMLFINLYIRQYIVMHAELVEKDVLVIMMNYLDNYHCSDSLS